MGEHGVARSESSVARGNDATGHVNARNQGTDPRDLAVGPRGERVLVVDARPFDPDVDLTRRQVDCGEIPDASLDVLALPFGDEGAERGRQPAHRPMLPTLPFGVGSSTRARNR